MELHDYEDWSEGDELHRKLVLGHQDKDKDEDPEERAASSDEIWYSVL